MSHKEPFCFADFVKRKMEHSYKTWPEQSLAGVLAHARKECDEIEANPRNTLEWVDLILLGIDGACRVGLTPDELISLLNHKLSINIHRTWPKPASPDHPGEHDRQNTVEHP